MSFSGKKKDRSFEWGDIIVFMVIILVALAIYLTVGPFVWHKGEQLKSWIFGDNESQEQGIEMCLESEATPIVPPPLNDFQMGEILGVGETYTFEPIACSAGAPAVQIHRGDVIRILGKTFEGSWHWFIYVSQSGLYAQGCIGLLPDDEPLYLYPTELGERPVPDLAKNDIARADCNFKLRASPGGEVILGKLGLPLYVLGGQIVTLKEDPMLYEGRYWCLVQPDNSDIIGWISCELKKIPQVDTPRCDFSPTDSLSVQPKISKRTFVLFLFCHKKIFKRVNWGKVVQK